MKKKIFPKLYLCIMMAFFYLPIIYVIVFSFNNTRSLSNFTGFSLRWYEQMLRNRTMMESIYYTIIIAILATVISTIVGTLTAIGLSRSKRIIKESITQVNSSRFGMYSVSGFNKSYNPSNNAGNCIRCFDCIYNVI